MKEVLTLKEVDEFLESFKNNIFDLIICTENISQIIEQKKNNSQKIQLTDPFLGHYVSLCYSYCAITLSKLFIDKEKRSLIKFLNKLENFDYDEKLTELLEQNSEKFKKGEVGEYDFLLKSKREVLDKIKEIKKIIYQSESLVIKIKDRRDSFYAHFDPSKIKTIEVESLSEIMELTNTAQTIYNIFFGGLKNKTFLFVNFWSVDKILELNIDFYDRMAEEIK